MPRVVDEGEGTVRIAVDAEAPVVQEIKFRHQGPLSVNGKEQVHFIVDRRMAELAEVIRSPTEPGPNGSPLAQFASELKQMMRYEELRIVKTLIDEGNYLTLENGSPWPPTSQDRGDYAYGPVALASGKWGIVIVMIDRTKRPSTRDLTAAIQETLSADREQRIQEFNAKPDGERRAWCDRFQELTTKAASDLQTLDADELRAFMVMSREVKYLRARVEPTGAWLVPL